MLDTLLHVCYLKCSLENELDGVSYMYMYIVAGRLAALVQLMVHLVKFSFWFFPSSLRPKKTLTFDWVAPSF